MELHNKNIDRLFRNGLENIEAEPSANVWHKIAGGLNQPVAKRGQMPYLRIAASVLILLGAGTWLLLKQPSSEAQGNKRTKQLTQITKRPAEMQPEQTTTPAAKEHATPTFKPENTVASSKKTITHQREAAAVPQTSKKITLPQQPAEPLLASANVPAINEVSAAVVPDEIDATKPVVDDAPVFKPITAPPVTQTLAAVPAAKTKTKKHGIHSLGDVVNLLIAKVDKREDKLIEFTDTDDDEAVVTGINLGLFRVKKEQ